MSNGALTTSGSSALDLAFAFAGLRSGQRVGVPDFGCHEIAASVLRSGGVPVALPVDGTKLLRASPALSNAGLFAVVAVHQFGLRCDIAALRRVLPDTTVIIEDAAQLLPLPHHREPADVTVASFGSGKPVDLGEGGAALANCERIERMIDRWHAPQRTRPDPVLPVALSAYAVGPLKGVWQQSMDARLETARRVRTIAQRLFEMKLIAEAELDSARQAVPLVLPLRCDTDGLTALKRFADVEGLEVNRPHPIPLRELPMLADLLDTSLLTGERSDDEDLRLLDLRALFRSSALAEGGQRSATMPAVP